MKLNRTVKKRLVKAVLFIGVVIYAFATGTPPEEDDYALKKEHEVDLTVHQDLSKPELSDELKFQIDTWVDEGFIIKIQDSSHELWVDNEIWNSHNREEKEKIVTLLSHYMKTIDGTQQVVVKINGEDSMAADFFANTLRIY